MHWVNYSKVVQLKFNTVLVVEALAALVQAVMTLRYSRTNVTVNIDDFWI